MHRRKSRAEEKKNEVLVRERGRCNRRREGPVIMGRKRQVPLVERGRTLPQIFHMIWELGGGGTSEKEDVGFGGYLSKRRRARDTWTGERAESGKWGEKDHIRGRK